MADIKIAGTLHNTEAIQGDDLHSHVVANANEILDAQKEKKQSDINADVDAALDDRYTKDETYNKSELNNMITTPDVEYITVQTYVELLAITDHPEGAIYRVANWDGTQVVTNKYTEYSYDGTGYVILAVRDHGIANASDFNNPTSAQRNLIPTVGAFLDGMDATPTAGSVKPVQSGGVEKYLAKEKTIVNDPTIEGGYINSSGTVVENSDYGHVVGIELKSLETILVNNGNSSYRPSGAPALFKTTSDGVFVESIIATGGSQTVIYTNTGNDTIYVGFTAYDRNGARQCKYTITKLAGAAGLEYVESIVSAEQTRAQAVEGNKLSVNEAQALTDAQKAQALSNLGISGIDVTPTPNSTKLTQSGGTHDYIRGESKMLVLYGINTNTLLSSVVSNGFLPNHRYRFTIVNFSDWTFNSAVVNASVVLRLRGYNNKECVNTPEENLFQINVLDQYIYSNYVNETLPNVFEFIFPNHITKIVTENDEETEVDVPVNEWFVKIEARASNEVLKIFAEDITDTWDTKKEEKLNESDFEWIEMSPDGYFGGNRVLSSQGVINTYSNNQFLYYYKGKKDDIIKFNVPSGNVTRGICASESFPVVGTPFETLVETTSRNTVNSSTITLTKDCYVLLNLTSPSCTYIVKNRGLGMRVKNLESAVSADEDTLNSVVSDVNELKNGISVSNVTDSCAYLDKQVLLGDSRGYYFDDTYANETSYIDTSYMDRKIQEIPDGKHFIFLTDSHIDYNNGIGITQNATPVIKYVRDRLGIKNVIFGGDAIGKRPTKYIAAKVLSIYAKELFEAFGSDFLFVMGNHDTNAFVPTGGTLEDALISDVEVYKRTTKFMKDYGKAVFPTKLIDIIDTSTDLEDESDNLMTQDEKDNYKAWAMMNYYYDDNRQKIRYIVLETGDSGMTMRNIFGMEGDAGNSLLTVGYFFVEALKTVPQGYDVVVTGHWIVNSGRFWNRVFYKTLALYKNKQSDIVSFAPNAWGTTHVNVAPIVEKTFDNPASLSITVDFTNNVGSGRVFCISGHTHYDKAVIKEYVADGEDIAVSDFLITTSTTPQSKTYTSASILHVVCDRCCSIGQGQGYTNGTTANCYSYPNHGTGEGEETRLGTISEVLFDVVTLTPDNRVVLTRFGAEGTDNDLPYVRNYVLPMASE